ncbi:casein kinase I-like protein, partial [Euroglyphus maynei]
GLINAKLFETADSKHIPKISANDNEQEPRKFGVYGTPRYMSLHAHKGKELSRRDDLESIGYMLLYFLHGKLPWQGLPVNNSTNNNSDKYENIFITKKMIHLDELCANLPPEYYHYMLYVRSLKFAQEPNYRYLITMFTKLLYRINMDQSRLVSPLINDMAITFDEQLSLNGNNNN